MAPTLYELAQVTYPKSYRNVQAHQLPGKSLVPLLTGKAQTVDRPEGLFWERAGNRAARIGKWKLVSTWPSYSWELYDLEQDPTETNDVARQHHAVVSRLSAAYFGWANQNDVVDFYLLEDKEPLEMKNFRKSKDQ